MIAALWPIGAAVVITLIYLGIRGRSDLEHLQWQAAVDRAEQQQRRRFTKAMRP